MKLPTHPDALDLFIDRSTDLVPIIIGVAADDALVELDVDEDEVTTSSGYNATDQPRAEVDDAVSHREERRLPSE